MCVYGCLVHFTAHFIIDYDAISAIKFIPLHFVLEINELEQKRSKDIPRLKDLLSCLYFARRLYWKLALYMVIKKNNLKNIIIIL